MMNLSQFSQRDLERLSAYLDGALNPKETARLEARLRREPELRQALQAMRQTVGLLRSMPEVALPRNFTLSPDMVGTPRRARSYPALKLATALVAAAFVFVIGLDFLGMQRMRPAVAPLVEREAVMEEVPAEVPEPAEAMKAAEVPEAETMPGETVMDNMVQEVEPTTGVLEPEAEGLVMTPEDEVTLAPPSPVEEYRAEEPQATSTPFPDGALGAAAPGTEEPVAGTGEEADMEASTEAAATFFEEEAPSEAENLVEQPPAAIHPFRYIEIGLGVALILLIVLSLTLRKQAS